MSTDAAQIETAARSGGRGEVVRFRAAFIPTTREPPADAESASHQLLVRAGFIRPVGAGIYTYLPLAWRTLNRISAIVREEMNAAGASELLMPALEPIELMRKTGRDVDYGDNLFRLEDRHGRTLALAPTHEEIVTDLLRGEVGSYKQLPLILYQIQTKFRDEFRPRSGLLRCREFIMKDAYSFHLTVDGPGGLDEAYEAMRQAYCNIFRRCGLDFTVVEAEAGPIGGSASHEFMVNCPAGEDVILRCPETGYAANVEKCEIGERPWSFEGEPAGELEQVPTPGAKSIEEVCALLGVEPSRMLKCVLFAQRRAEGGERFVLAVVRGDHEVNEAKVKAAAGGPVELADEQRAREAGFAVGYISPRAVADRPDALLVIDPDAAQGIDPASGGPIAWTTGADEPDSHVRNFHWRRELGGLLEDASRLRVADIRNARAGDPSPRAPGARLVESRGIEVGHIFRLGTKYSEAMGLTVLDEAQQRRPVIMGCYGVGVSRTMAACVEMSHDEDGVVWPAPIAPFDVHIAPLKIEGEVMAAAQQLAHQLAERGLDVLLDDRD
ncbi:MAG: proline--tRNA ligase, partial [Planctomycetota bacterium]